MWVDGFPLIDTPIGSYSYATTAWVYATTASYKSGANALLPMPTYNARELNPNLASSDL